MGKQLQELTAVGQSIWLDNIRRSMFPSGELQKLIDSGLRGMTSNPTIFEKAIGSGNDYDKQLASLIGKQHDPQTLFEALAVQDIRSACDLFRPLYDSTHGLDGYVSLEVAPTLARDSDGTIAAAKRLWAAVDRPNVMIKIPGTPECTPAIRAVIGAGINVNVTLLFDVDRYETAALAYVAGIEDRIGRGEPVDKIASVASVFVSRIDTAVDKQIDAKIAQGNKFEHLLGKAGTANLKLTYQRFLKIFHGERFAKARAAGAHVMRPLWASTGTKNPAYSDLMYVETVIGKETVNTVPPPTLDALLDHGKVVADTVLSDLDAAKATIADLAKAQISLFEVTEKLLVDGVASFADSFTALLAAIEYKQKALAEGSNERVSLRLGNAKADADAALAKLSEGDFLNKLWKHDASPWSADPAHVAIIKNALGWLNIPQVTHAASGDLVAFAKDCAKRFKHVVVLGMGGSSLAPDVLRATFGQVAGFPQLHVLDSTDPVQIKALDDALDIKTSLFLVASKSGTTTEPDAFFRYYYDKVQKLVGSTTAGDQFIAITDPGTKLEAEAKGHNFLRTFVNAPDIGGRYSALSYFGMVPAALAGYDITTILDRAKGAMFANAASIKVIDAPGIRFGSAIGGLAKTGKDKLTIVTHPLLAAFGAWAEQLIAESTGKSGTGIVPVEGEPLGAVEAYGTDRVFVYVGMGLPDADAAMEKRLDELAAAGHPVIRLQMTDALDIGEQFFTWEIATAAAGSVIGIDAFDQPNVQESKDNTKRLLAEYTQNGKFSEPTPKLTASDAAIMPLRGSSQVALGTDLDSAIAAIAAQIRPGDYVALNAYVAMTPEHVAFFRAMRTKIRDAFRVATTVGFGPRFLHSTGQLHKGGPPSGVYLQITADVPFDLEIPGMTGFRTLERSQALGDFESLDKRDRRGARVHFPGNLAHGLAALAAAVDDAATAKA